MGYGPDMRTSLVSVGLWALVLLGPGGAQTAPDNGPRELRHDWHALIHARVVQAPGKVLENATLVLRDGLIRSIASGGKIPDGARIWDCRGMTVYAGLIEAWEPVPVATLPGDRPGRHWNDQVQAERSGAELEKLEDKRREALQRLGFCAIAAVPDSGILRGRATTRQLDEAGTVLRRHSYHGIGLRRNRGGYPNSLMGVFALIRQTLSDAEGHAARQAAVAAQPQRFAALAPQHALEVLHQQRGLPLAFQVGDAHSALRCLELAREAGRSTLLVGGEDAYQRLPALQRGGARFILPVGLPEVPEVADPAKADAVSLRSLQHWEQAPRNLARLQEAGIPVALSSTGLEKLESFWTEVHKMIAQGAEPDAVLGSLTTVPAGFLGLSDRLGRVEVGKVANLLVCKGSLFDKTMGKPRPDIRSLWIGGRHVSVRSPSPLLGDWQLQPEDLAAATLRLGSSKRGSLQLGEDKHKLAHLSVGPRRLSFVLEKGAWGRPGPLRITAVWQAGETGRLRGQILPAEGSALSFVATPTAPSDEEQKPGDKAAGAELAPEPVLPLGAYGTRGIPAQEDLVIRNATIWTSGPQGIIQNGVLLVRKGKIAFCGPAAEAPAARGAVEINAEGKHLSPGMIDCHSHTGVRGGINESGQTCTAEVRIADVIDADDINWYRQLAGGLTAANRLHGSANPIGGQNHVVKLRWGVADPDAMGLAGARPGIKFALGENVKRSGRRREGPARYPGTRMGVESYIRDRFTAARDYARALERHRKAPQQHLPPLRDLELECLAGILAGERLVHCHSYRQDEILMLCRVAKEFGFTIGTFQHVLEGYKVAEAIRGAALGASAFSDWWAYKFEVFDAIAYNGALMHQVGVNVSFNSDSNELARRMNTEAAKAVKYGGVRPDEALKFVTLNPAIQLGVADRIGSLEPGKDADFVIWSGSPLSTLSRCLATYIDGRRYYAVEQDTELRSRDRRERSRLIRKALQAGAGRNSEKEDKSEDGQLDYDSASFRRHLLRHWRNQRRNLDCNCLRELDSREENR